MNQPRSSIATKALLLVAFFFAATLAYAAEVAGTVTHLSGPLLAKKADGTVKVLAAKSSVEQGDTLITEKDTYARIRFTDSSEITLKPNTQLKVDSFVFDEAEPAKDSAAFDLVKGGMRAITGLLGKRSKERVSVNTPTATIGIRGTIFIAEYIPPSQPAVAAYAFASVAALAPDLQTPAYLTMTDAPAAAAPLHLAQLAGPRSPPGAPNMRAPGLYVLVLDGMIHLSNSGGSQSFSAGQFGYTPSFQQPPVIVPTNPGIQFTPPPAFSSTTAKQGGTGGTPSSNNVDCEVR
ncbi:MAG: FecR family protein [Noviherbaspirillum sp.]